jgi:hypothetical protein
MNSEPRSSHKRLEPGPWPNWLPSPKRTAISGVTSAEPQTIEESICRDTPSRFGDRKPALGNLRSQEIA